MSSKPSGNLARARSKQSKLYRQWTWRSASASPTPRYGALWIVGNGGFAFSGMCSSVGDRSSANVWLEWNFMRKLNVFPGCASGSAWHRGQWIALFWLTGFADICLFATALKKFLRKRGKIFNFAYFSRLVYKGSSILLRKLASVWS